MRLNCEKDIPHYFSVFAVKNYLRWFCRSGTTGCSKFGNLNSVISIHTTDA